VGELRSYGLVIGIADPLADAHAAREEYGIQLQPLEELPKADAVIVAVAHQPFTRAPIAAFERVLNAGGVVVDVKACLDLAGLARAGFRVWRL
jgi:UDP-N-acetyl-D-galactosamine dehydrogenase